MYPSPHETRHLLQSAWPTLDELRDVLEGQQSAVLGLGSGAMLRGVLSAGGLVTSASGAAISVARRALYKERQRMRYQARRLKQREERNRASERRRGETLQALEAEFAREAERYAEAEREALARASARQRALEDTLASLVFDGDDTGTGQGLIAARCEAVMSIGGHILEPDDGDANAARWRCAHCGSVWRRPIPE